MKKNILYDILGKDVSSIIIDYLIGDKIYHKKKFDNEILIKINKFRTSECVCCNLEDSYERLMFHKQKLYDPNSEETLVLLSILFKCINCRMMNCTFINDNKLYQPK